VSYPEKDHTTTMNHTPEPWHVSGNYVRSHPDGKGYRIFWQCGDGPHPTWQADLHRAVACVNGCKGIPDPETTIPELIEALRFVAKQPTDQTASPEQCSMVAVAMDALAKLST
jgi:hypothetical protein